MEYITPWYFDYNIYIVINQSWRSLRYIIVRNKNDAIVAAVPAARPPQTQIIH